MDHHFSVDASVELGVNAAIILQNIAFWCDKNRANNQNEHDGRYWTYNSVKAFEMQFPYLSGKQIRGALKKLEDAGCIVTGIYNDDPRDRTKWYSVTQHGYEVMGWGGPSVPVCDENGTLHLPKGKSSFAQEGKSLYMNTDNKPYSDDEKPKEPKHKHGEYENVLLSDSEFSKLSAEFPDLQQRIERLSEYIASTGKVYKSHYATIRAWARKDASTAKVQTGPKWEPVRHEDFDERQRREDERIERFRKLKSQGKLFG